MRRVPFAAAFLCLLQASACAAQAGVALRWNHCFGEGTGLENRLFACDTNAGFEELVGSFVLPNDMTNVTGNQIVIDISTALPCACGPPPVGNPNPLPEWWKFMNAGSCRRTSLLLSTTPDPENVVCQDWGTGLAASAIASYQVDFRGTGTARLKALLAVPQTNLAALHAGAEYYSFTLRIRHDKTVGAGACAGCGLPLVLVLTSLNVTTDTPPNDRRLSGPLNGVDADFATWALGPVPTRPTSWSALKARFR